jgi:hypothetical protein
MATSNPYAALYAQKLGTASPVPADVPRGTSEPSALSKAGSFASDVGKGLGESAVSLMSTGDEFARKHLPAFLTNSNLGFGKPANLEHVREMATPENTTQAVSKGIGNAAQFLIPGGAEEKLASLAPRAIAPLARIATSALGAGAVNKAQGGSFGTGAMMGAGGTAVGQGLKMAAPIVAETALGIPKAARAFGKTPGAAILNETRGIRPETIASSAQERMGELTPELESAAARSSAPASLVPARRVLNDAGVKAANQNAGGLHSQVSRMGDTLNHRFDTGAVIPSQVSPSELLDLKRGFGEEHLRWNPEIHDRALSAGRQAYGALDKELDRTVPEAAGLNQRISSLIPVAHRAESVSRNAPALQRAAGRFGAHTGALTLGGVGAIEGRREGGLPGAIAGGITGVLAPELIASPEGQMLLARSLNKAGSLRFPVGAVSQLDRKREAK